MATGIYLTIAAAVLVLALVFVIVHGANNGWRFGRVFGKERLVGEATPYRASVHREVLSRGVPRTVWLGSLTSTIWGLVTLTIFVPPAGILALFMGASGEPGVAVAALPLLLICLSGLGLAVALLRQARRLLARDASSAETCVRWSLAHHAVVLTFFALAGFAAEGAEGVAMALLFVGVPCLVGVFQAMAIHAAADRLGRIDREEEAGAALPPELA